MIAKLGDVFPKILQKQHAADSLKLGVVLRFWVKDTDPPKPKRFIVVGFDNNNTNTALVFINSEINPTVFPTKPLRDLHVKFSVEDRPYLEHESYVDCTDILIKDYQMLKDAIVNDFDIILGDLRTEDLQVIQNKLNCSPIISKSKKTQFGL